MKQVASLLILLGIFLSPLPAKAADPFPTNSYVLENSWHCNEGYKRSGDRCVELSVPANAFISGNAWYCYEGFMRRGGLCVVLADPTNPNDALPTRQCDEGVNRGNGECVTREAPANAYWSGGVWHCKEGFKRSNDECISLNVPENAYISGNAWYCARGFTRRGNVCVNLNVPANAIGSADNWSCEDGYRRSINKCIGLDVPPNAYVSGNEWLCKEGYKRRNKRCVALEVPTYAHVSGNEWRCDSGYTRKRNECVDQNVPRNRPSSSDYNPRMPAQVSSERLSPEQIFGQAGKAVYIVFSADSVAAVKKKTGIVQGSAVAISENLALTNCHVVENGKIIFLKRNKFFSLARVKYHHEETDRCVLKIGEGGLQSIQGIRAFSELAIGETVYTIGSPRGFENTFGQGLVSGLRKKHGINIIQTSAPVSPGSSGGGLFDSFGNLIGITTFILKDAQNLNFAISADEYWK